MTSPVLPRAPDWCAEKSTSLWGLPPQNQELQPNHEETSDEPTLTGSLQNTRPAFPTGAKGTSSRGGGGSGTDQTRRCDADVERGTRVGS